MTGLAATENGGRAWIGPFWPFLALIAALWVALLNGGPLYYYDTGGYFAQGLTALRQLGLTAVASDASAGMGSAAAIAAEGDGLVNISRSTGYSLFAATVGLTLSPQVVPLVHALVLLGTCWLAVAVPLRSIGQGAGAGAILAAAILAATLGSLPFYVAYLMPDIMTGLLILIAALAIGFGPEMRRIEWLAAFLIAVFAVLAHPSHLPLAAGLLVLAVPGGALVLGRRWWMPAVFLALVLAGGLGERAAISRVAEKATGSAATVYPFLTARLIQDEVGFYYLEKTCPDEELATCRLYDQLLLSQDPLRLTASHIIFETNPNLGSYRLLAPADQKAISDEQVEFAWKAVIAIPAMAARAVLRNTLRQARMASIEMTIARPGIVDQLHRLSGLPEGSFTLGRLSADRTWIGGIDRVHTAVYTISLALLALLVILPGRLSAPFRVFAFIVVLGILGNAVICGALSQPANRYGARVIWLLPFTAAFLTAIWFRLGRTSESRP